MNNDRKIAAGERKETKEMTGGNTMLKKAELATEFDRELFPH